MIRLLPQQPRPEPPRQQPPVPEPPKPQPWVPIPEPPDPNKPSDGLGGQAPPGSLFGISVGFSIIAHELD